MKKKKQHKFQITEEQYDIKDSFKPYKSVMVDGKEIFRIDRQKYMGNYRDQTKEVLEVLSKMFKKDITKDKLQRAITFGILEI